MSKMPGTEYLSFILTLGCIVIGLFSTIFLFYTNSFLLISDAGNAVVIDPAAEVQEYDKILKEHGGKLSLILCTHGHYDHVGSAGVDPRVEAEKTHRIDPAVIERDFPAAGFRLVTQSDVLRNPGDDISKLVFDPTVRGKTDRRVWLFEKPAS